MTRYDDETGARRNEPDGQVPYTLTPAGQAVAAHPDTWDRDLWVALDAGEQPGPQAEREARRQSDAEAWGGRGPSASYAEWLAEGQAETEAEADADWSDEWDSADSNAYQDRVEAGLEPEAEL